MIFIDLVNKENKLYNKILKVLKNTNKKIIVNTEKAGFKSDNIKFKNIKSKALLKKYINKSDIIIVFDIIDCNKYKGNLEKIILLYEENTKLSRKIESYSKITYKSIDDINSIFDIEKQKTKEKKSFKFIYFIFILIISLLVLIIFNQYKLNNNLKYEINKVNRNYTNYLFLGDSITEVYDLDKYYKAYKVVNSGISGDQTNNIYDNLNKRAYIYNPSTIFLLIGTNDFEHGKTNEEIVKKIEDIIYEINLNLPNAKVYLESIYPVNNTNDEKINKEMVGERDNNRIKDVNKSLKKYCNNKNCTYLDIYDLLKDSDGNLKLEYTKDGLHMSSKGYEIVTKELKKYMNKEK